MADLIEKVCPYLLRGSRDAFDILAFRHPLAGCQIVKGTLESGEPAEVGAVRELAEESGLTGTIALGSRWISTQIVPGQRWHFLPVAAEAVPERFDFWTKDDGGHVFSFFWWPLEAPLNDSWHHIFRRAVAEIKDHCAAR